MSLTSVAAEAARRRPRALYEVAVWGAELGNIDRFLRELLDEFYSEPDPGARAAMLRDEPPLFDEPRRNAYLAAVAEHLASRNQLQVPDWTEAKERFLDEPFFPCGLESLKPILLQESPPAFRRRMIFVGADPLYRPRRDARGIGN